MKKQNDNPSYFAWVTIQYFNHFGLTQVVHLVCDYAVKLDKQNGKSRLQDASQLEMSQVYENEAF